ncbi:MAG: response regulator transcription factor [Albidovulum sp.]|nr:response regulator transcription factor [Albidovulum sp.]
MPDNKPLPYILLVDDDDRIRSLLKQCIESNGFLCATSRNASEAERKLSVLRFDLMVLDVMMPGESGLEFAARLVRNGETMPIIMLTARDSSGARVEGLRTGVDDYIQKPCDPEELVLRINAVLRRSAQQGDDPAELEILKFGEFNFHFRQGKLWRGEKLVHLTENDISILRRFAKSPNETVPREFFVAHTNSEPGQEGFRAVDVMISRLRRKIEENPRQPRFIRTVRGVGYAFLPD